jgi:hypothetical protein
MISLTSKLEGAPINIVYSINFYKYHPLSDKNVYVVVVTSYDAVKITNIKYIYDAQEEAIKHLLSNDKKIDSSNSVVFTIYDFKKGLRFMPDLRTISRGVNFKANIEKDFNITLGGIIVVLGNFGVKKYKKLLIQLAKIFTNIGNLDVVDSIEESYMSMEKFSVNTHLN